jgi:triosephosphate isomerase
MQSEKDFPKAMVVNVLVENSYKIKKDGTYEKRVHVIRKILNVIVNNSPEFDKKIFFDIIHFNMRKKIIAGNWKMHKTIDEAKNLAREIKNMLKNVSDVEIVLCPPFTSLYIVYQEIKDTNILLGAQNMFWEKEGAYTGEISPLMLKDAGCKYVIIGHSERRQYFKETDQDINKKIKIAIKYGLNPIVCVGEKLEEREKGETYKIVKTQISKAFENIEKEEMKNVVIAYEPVWAIGTGKNATGEDANSVISFIRMLLKEKYGEEISNIVRIQYGGSVKPENIKEFMEMPEIDGALVGGASINAESFSKIVKFKDI